MDKDETRTILELFNAIEDDWAICDDRDEDDHMVLVNEDRDENEDLKPLKSLIAKLEKEGLIELDTQRSDAKGSKRKYMGSLDGTSEIPIPFVFMYKITSKGLKFRDENNKP